MLAENREKERSRLVAVMDGYLAAFVRRDYRQIKFAPHLKATDNSVAMPIGAGIGRTVRGLRDGGHYFADPAAGQVEYWGVIDEMGTETIFGIRLKVEGSLISEVETLGVRNTDPYYFPDVILSADAGFHDILPLEERATREEMVEIANRYFDAIEQNDGSLVPVRDDCQRLVNGAEDTLTDVSDLAESEAHRAMTVSAQISDGHYGYIESLRGRRFPIVDVERGIVLAHVLFDHPGDLPKPDGSVPFGQPNTMLAFEAFKVKRSKIEAVWAICYQINYGSPSGWGEGKIRKSIKI